MNLICSAILFDLDGVLVDSAPVIERHWQRWGNHHGVELARIMALAHGRPSVEVMAAVAPHLDAVEEARLMEAAAAVDEDGLTIFDAARSLLAGLPDGRWAVVTSGNNVTATTRLRLGRFPTPPVLVTADDVAHGKPHPEPYLQAAARLGVEPAGCVVVEDAPAGIEAGRAAGMRVLAVATTHAPEQLSAADAVLPVIDALTVREQDGRLHLHVAGMPQEMTDE